ncbi:MAG: homoserine dehydrogenase [Nitrosopumilaceae archaeon]|nr:homoserine dehydrogenase [Nitrosopumilaceae archaeon]
MRIILCGFGGVGQSLVKLFDSRSDDLYAKFGLKPRVVAVFDTKGSAVSQSGLDLRKLIEVKKKFGTVGKYADKRNKLSGVDLIKNLDADVLIETSASNYKDAEPGMTHITTAMKHKMHVISVNKGPLALAFPSLYELATYNQVLFKFSGTVGGGTPILDYAKDSLCGERIISFKGILNGTTNYILTNMAGGLSFDEALQDAKAKGYVEADESLDLDGLDAAAKLVILANWIMDMKVTLPDIDCTGIRKVTQQDIKNAAKKNCAVKLIASCNKELKVGPEEIPENDPLCVDGTLNAISFTSEHSGTQTIIGRGAGGMETASSILRDLLDIRQEIARN